MDDFDSIVPLREWKGYSEPKAHPREAETPEFSGWHRIAADAAGEAKAWLQWAIESYLLKPRSLVRANWRRC